MRRRRVGRGILWHCTFWFQRKVAFWSLLHLNFLCNLGNSHRRFLIHSLCSSGFNLPSGLISLLHQDSMAHYYLLHTITKSLLLPFPFNLLTWPNHYMDSTHFSAYFTLVSKEQNTGGKTQPSWLCACEFMNPNFQELSALFHCLLDSLSYSPQRAIHTSSLANLFLLTLS